MPKNIIKSGGTGKLISRPRGLKIIAKFDNILATPELFGVLALRYEGTYQCIGRYQDRNQYRKQLPNSYPNIDHYVSYYTPYNTWVVSETIDPVNNLFLYNYNNTYFRFSDNDALFPWLASWYTLTVLSA